MPFPHIDKAWGYAADHRQHIGTFDFGKLVEQGARALPTLAAYIQPTSVFYSRPAQS